MRQIGQSKKQEPPLRAALYPVANVGLGGGFFSSRRHEGSS